MKTIVMFLSLALVLGPVALIAEQHLTDSNTLVEEPSSSYANGVTLPSANPPSSAPRPFSLGAMVYGVSPLGLQLQFTTNVNRHLNLRSNVNSLSLRQDFASEGWDIQTLIHMASTGTSIDLYPFPNHGFYISPGVLFHNPFVIGGLVPLGSPNSPTFKLNGQTYYSSTTEPASAVAIVNLRSTAFTLTTGWGNVVSHRTGRFYFPVELGIAFLGSPTVKTVENGGQLCDDQQLNCVDAGKDPTLLSNLQAEAVKYRSNLDLLRTYPVFSIGVAYRFRLKTNDRE